MSLSSRLSRHSIAALALGVATMATGSVVLASGPAAAKGGGPPEHANSHAHARAAHAGKPEKAEPDRNRPQQAEPERNRPQRAEPAQPEPAAKPEKDARPQRQEHDRSGADKPEKAERARSVTADRPGNNGTIKIDTAPYDTHPNNQPHVSCEFQVDYYNYGEGDYSATAAFSMHSPTADGTLSPSGGTTFVGDDPPGGGTDLDGEETYTLSFTGEPHPQQGYHVKLTVHARDSLGADTKHKVFWVQPCERTVVPAPDDNDEGLPEENDEEVPGENDEELPGPDDESEQETGESDVSVQQPSTPTLVTSPGETLRETVAGSTRTRAQASSQARLAASAREAETAAVPTAVAAGLAGSERLPVGAPLATSLFGLSGLLAAAAVLAHRRRGARQT